MTFVCTMVLPNRQGYRVAIMESTGIWCRTPTEHLILWWPPNRKPCAVLRRPWRLYLTCHYWHFNRSRRTLKVSLMSWLGQWGRAHPQPSHSLEKKTGPELCGWYGRRKFNLRWTNLCNMGLTSADRSNKATLPLTVPSSKFKSSAKDSTLHIFWLQYADKSSEPFRWDDPACQIWFTGKKCLIWTQVIICRNISSFLARILA